MQLLDFHQERRVCGTDPLTAAHQARHASTCPLDTKITGGSFIHMVCFIENNGIVVWNEVHSRRIG